MKRHRTRDLKATTETQHQMKSRLFLNVVVSQGTTILELLASEDETLLVWWDSLLVLNLSLDVVNGVGALNFEGDRLSGKSLHKDLHATTETQHQVKGRLFLNVVVSQGTTILELLAGEDQTLLVGRNTLLVLDLSFHVVDGVGALHLECDSLSGESLNEDLHTTAEPEDEMKGRLLLDVVISESTSILELLPGEDKPLLIRWDSLLVLDLGLDVVDGVRAFHLKGDGLSGESLHEDLHLEP